MRWEAPISDSYRAPLWSAIFWTVGIVVLSALVLDGGDILRLNCGALLLFWGTVTVIVLRRRRNPTPGDIWLIRSGSLPLVVVFQVVVRMVWYLRGLS